MSVTYTIVNFAAQSFWNEIKSFIALRKFLRFSNLVPSNLVTKITTWEQTYITGSPSSKYENRRALALLRNIQNIRICMGKKPIVSVTFENERISIKNSLP